MRCPRILFALVLAILAVTLSGSALASTTDIYIAQNAAGGNTGADCADAHPATWFNSSVNWGTGNGQIGPGVTVHLCGTISSAISAQGNGSSSSPITIAFDCASNGQISMPAIPSTGALSAIGRSYITVDGQSCGIIKSTDNGQSGFGNSVPSQAIIATNSTNIEVKNLTCGPLYLHNTTATTSFGAPFPVCVNFTGPNSANITIDHNTFTDCAWCGWGQGSNISFHDNTIANFDHGLGMGIQSDTPTVWGPVYFYNNSISHAITWDTGSAGQYHHDGVHLWAYCSDGSTYCSGTYWNNVYIYNNHFFGDWGPINTTAFIFNEANIHNEYIFNNFGDCTANQCDDNVFNAQDLVNGFVANNTVVTGLSTQATSNLAVGGPNLTVQNNIVSTSNFLIDATPANRGGNGTTFAAFSNNIYMVGGNNAFVWHTTFLSFSQFPTWESSSGEHNGVVSSSSTINMPSGTLQAGSAAIGAGANLYSACNGQPNPGLGALCSDATGAARPMTGPWDAGAFSFANGNNPPAPPTGLAAVVQ